MIPHERIPGGAELAPWAHEIATAPPGPAALLPRRGIAGIFFVALGVLVLEVALTRLLSVVAWYHFAFVVISLAMLGLAIAGVLLYLVPPLVRGAPGILPWSCRLAGASMVLALLYVAHSPFTLGDTGRLFSKEVAVFYLVALAPFLFAGLAISATLARYPKQVTTLYFADLLGAGIGCVLAVGLLEYAGAPAAILVAAAACLAGGGLLRREGKSSAIDAILAILAIALAVAAFQPQHSTEPHSGEDLRDPFFQPFEPRYDKGIAPWMRRDLTLFSGWNAHSRIRIYEPLEASDGGPAVRTIDIDGNATTGIVHIEGQASAETVEKQAPFLRTWLAAPPYAILPERPRVLIIGPGGGRDVLTALLHRAEVTAVEVNGLIVDLMTKGPFAEWSGWAYRAPGVTAVHDEARSWVRRTSDRFDLIQATLVDTWAATSSGAFGLAENSLYTVEGFDDLFEHLTEGGVVHIVRWHRDPPRESLRAVALMTEVMKRRGVPSPERHIVIGLDAHGLLDGAMPYASMIWSRASLDDDRLGRLLAFGKWREEQNPRLAIVPSYIPGAPVTDDVGRYLTSPDRRRFVEDYPYDIRPATDDRPFFFNTVRLGDVAMFRREKYENEQAVVVLMTVLGVVVAIVVAAFVIPFVLTLGRLRRASGPGTAASLVYFCGIGIGFMLVEIPLLQRFGLYLGHPTHALSTILAVLLTSTGLGSSLAGWWFGRHHVRGARVALVLVMLSIGALVFIVPGVLAPTLSAPLPVRIGVTAGLLFPLGLLMGFPLPLGVRALESGRSTLIPWAWGMNGAASVLASVLAVATGMYAGFTIAILAGGAAYAVAFATAGKLRGTVQLLAVETSRPPAPPAGDAPPPQG